jgi:hypothetical protein
MGEVNELFGREMWSGCDVRLVAGEKIISGEGEDRLMDAEGAYTTLEPNPGMLVDSGAAEDTFSHEFGHQVHWRDPIHPMVRKGKVDPSHSSLPHNLMHYDQPNPKPDEQWCRKACQAAQDGAPR